jgi:hypothetical protein
LPSQNTANGWAIYVYDMRVADKADTYRTSWFDQRQLTLLDTSKKTQMDVKYIAIFKTIKKVLSKRLDGKTKLAGEKRSPVSEPSLW